MNDTKEFWKYEFHLKLPIWMDWTTNWTTICPSIRPVLMIGLSLNEEFLKWGQRDCRHVPLQLHPNMVLWGRAAHEYIEIRQQGETMCEKYGLAKTIDEDRLTDPVVLIISKTVMAQMRYLPWLIKPRTWTSYQWLCDMNLNMIFTVMIAVNYRMEYQFILSYFSLQRMALWKNPPHSHAARPIATLHIFWKWHNSEIFIV